MAYPKTYKTDKGVYEIPEKEAASFLKDFPNAMEVVSYKMGKDTFDIPVKETEVFLKENPQAVPLKKKEQSDNGLQEPSVGGLDGTIPTITQDELDKQDDVIGKIQEADALSKKTRFWGMGGGGGEVPDFDAIAKSKEIHNQLKGMGYGDNDIEILTKTFSDLPKEAEQRSVKQQDGTVAYPYSKKSFLELYKSNPIAAVTKANNVKNFYELRNAAGEWKASEYNSLAYVNDETKPINVNIDNFNQLKERQKELINTALPKEKRQKALDRIEENSDIILSDIFKDEDNAKNYLIGKLQQKDATLKLSNPTVMEAEGKVDGDLSRFSLESIAENLDPKNKAENLAFRKYKYTVDLDNAINSSADLNQAAVTFAAEQNPQIKGQIEKLDGTRLPNAYEGEIVNQFLNSPDVIKRAEQDPEFAAKYNQAKNNLYFNYPEFAKKEVATKISQAMEDRGMTNWFANIPTKEGTDKLVDDLVRTGKLTEQDKLVYDKQIRNDLGVWQSVKRGVGRIPFGAFIEESPIQTPGLLESTQNAFNKTIHGVARSVEDVINIPAGGEAFSAKERLYNKLQEDASFVNLIPKSTLHEVSMGTGHLAGFVIPMMAGGAALRGVKGAEFISNGLMFEGENKSNALKLFPDNPTKQYAYTAIATAGDMMLGHLIPKGDAAKGISKTLKGDIVDVVNKFTNKEITAAQAKQTLLNKTTSLLGDLAKENTKVAGTITGFGVFHNTLDALFGANNMSAGDIATQAVKDFKSTFLTTPILAAMAVKGRASGINGKVLMEVASNPELYKKVIAEQSALNPELKATEKERLQNLEDAASIKKDLDKTEMTDKQKQDYMVTAINKKILERKAAGITDKTLKQSVLDQAEKHDTNLVLLKSEFGDKEFKDLTPEERDRIEPPKDHTVKTQPSGTEGKFTPVIINKNGEHEVLNKSFDTPEAAKVYGEETVKKRYFDENIKNKEEELPDLSQPIPELNVDNKGIPIGENVPPEVKGEPEKITQPIELSVSTKTADVQTDKGKMEGSVTDKIEVNDVVVALPEKGFVISDVTLNKGEEKGKGSGQEIYKKALDEYGTLYSSFPISEDAMRVQNKLVEKGIAKIETITLSDGTEIRKITKIKPTDVVVDAKQQSGKDGVITPEVLLSNAEKNNDYEVLALKKQIEKGGIEGIRAKKKLDVITKVRNKEKLSDDEFIIATDADAQDVSDFKKLSNETAISRVESHRSDKPDVKIGNALTIATKMRIEKMVYDKTGEIVNSDAITLNELRDKIKSSTPKAEPQQSGKDVVVDEGVGKITLNYNEKGEHLAPNGNPSKLSEPDAKLVRTPEFKKDFGDWEKKDTDIVLDENGEPLKVYHGTAFDPKEGMFSEFDNAKNYFGFTFFSDNPNAAKEWARDRETWTRVNQHIVEAFIKIKKPEIKEYNGERLPNEDIESFKSKNVDGVILKNVIDTAEGKPIVNNVYGVKDKSQIKSLNLPKPEQSLSTPKAEPQQSGKDVVVDEKTKQQLLDERFNKIKQIKDKAEGTREERTKRYVELVKEFGNEMVALKKLQEEINKKAQDEIDKLPPLPKTENELVNEKGESDFNKIKKDLGFKNTDLKWGDNKNPFGEEMGDMLLNKDKDAVIFIKPNEVEVYDEINDSTDTITNGIKIELVSTKEGSRGKGKAKELIQKVTDWADKNNTDIYLDIAPQDSKTTDVGLKKLYESFGFEFDGIHGIRKPKDQSLSTKPEIKNEEPKVKIPIPKEEGGITETKTGQGVPETETGEKIRQNILAAAEGKKSERSKRIAMEEEAAKYGEEGAKILSNIGGEPPKEPPKPTEEKGGKDKLNDKGILNHLFSAENVPESAKSGFKEKGLKYNTASQKEAEMVAKSIIEEYGIDDAVLLAEAQKFDGDVNSLIYAESLNRLAKLEEAAKTPEEKFEFTKKFAEVGIKYDEAGRKGGRFNAAINYFYKKSPLGIKMIENAKRKEAFEEWAKPKDKSWKEFFDEMIKEPEFDAIIKEQVKEGMKQERAEARAARIKKVDEFFDKAKDQFKGGAAYSTIIPPKVITTALEGMKRAYHTGEKVAKLVEDAIDYISEQIGHSEWDREKFRKEWTEKLKDKETKKPLTDEEIKAKILDKFRNKLKGLTDKEKEEVVRRSFQKIVESGGLDYADFKKIIADITGRGELTEAETARLKELVKETNLVDEAAEKARTERTQEARKAYFEAQTKAAKASKELNELLYNRPNIVKRLTSIMQLNTLGIPALVNNPIYNIWNQTTLRLPVGVVKTVIDQAIKYGSGGKIAPETQIVSKAVQAEFFSKLGLGTKEAFQQFFTGLNRADYTAKEIQGQQIRPATAWRDLWAFMKGKKNLTGDQALDKSLQATVGIPAEIVARTLNLGDKPQRFAAEGAQASAFAKALGLKDIDYDLFIDFPREEAYMQYKKQGLSDAEAAKKADYIKDTIIKEGQRSTFQQDNMLNDVINRVFGGEQSGIGSLAKAVTISPYIKIPSNAYWSYYNLINPEVALLQSAIYGTKAGLKKSGKFNRFLGDKYNTSAEKDLNESKYWFAHAAVGMATRAVVVSLVGAGIVRPSNTADDTKKEREGEQNYEQQGTINVSKMFAAAQGKDPDEVNNGLNVGLRWFGHFGTMSDRIAKKNEEMTPEQKEKQDEFLNIAFGGLEVDALRDLNTGVFGNTSSLLTSVERGDFKNYGTNLINMFANVMQPAALAQVERAAMPYYTKQKADTFLGELNNTMLNRSKLYRDLTKQYPPSKIGIWGDKVEKKDNLPMRLFGISRANPDNFAQPIYEDYKRTSNTQFLPPSVKPEISGNGQTIKLPTKDAARLEELVGQQRKNLAAPYVNDMANFEGSNKTYSKLSDEEKIDKLNIIYDEGYKNGKELFLKEYPQYIIPEKTKQEKTEDKKESSANRKFRKAIKNK